jgi:hypothetical protein
VYGVARVESAREMLVLMWREWWSLGRGGGPSGGADIWGLQSEVEALGYGTWDNTPFAEYVSISADIYHVDMIDQNLYFACVRHNSDGINKGSTEPKIFQSRTQVPTYTTMNAK